MKDNIGCMVEVLSERIHKLRTQQNRTLEDLAMDAGIGIQTLKQLESGRSDCYLSTVLRLADALGVSIDFLAGREMADDSHNITFLIESLSESNRKTLLKLIRLMKIDQESDKFNF